MAKEVTFEIDAAAGTVVQDGALFVGGQTDVSFSGYVGTKPILILFQRRPGNVLAPVQITKTPEGAEKPQLDLNNEEARRCFTWNNRERPQSKVVLEAYVVDGESVEVETVESVSKLVVGGSKWILASGQAQVGWAPLNFEADGTAVSLKGDKGDAGAAGPQGEKGEKGEKGDRGDRGEKGEKGDRGERGDVGATGPQGPRGERGEQGATGPKGDKGDVGATGPKGERGDRGEKGERGPQGVAGATGANGVDGLSAYEIAVNHGYEGTEEQWNAEETGLHYSLEAVHKALTERGEELDVVVQSLNALQEV